MAMLYPILFPYGEHGFKIDIKYRELGRKHNVARQYVTTREFYAYKI